MITVTIELFISLCAVVIILVVISLCLIFRLRDLTKEFDDKVLKASKKAFNVAMSVKIQEEDAYHEGYMQAMHDVHSDKTLIQAELNAICDEIENRLEGK